MNKHRQFGFTLVEIAIVLVIIGLLLGAVLKGQEFITQAKIRNVANDFNGLAAAVLSYQERYRALPGDDAGASRWPNMNAGGGDGSIAGSYNPANATDETALLWRHLRASGFIAGDPASGAPPTNPAGGIIGIQNGGLGLTGPVICSANLPARVAGAIDVQFDDGNATSGSVRALLQTGSNDSVSNSAPTTNYVDNGSNLYVVCKSL